MDKSIPPDKWWRIAKSVCKLNKCNIVSPPIKHEGRIIIHPSEKCHYRAKSTNNPDHWSQYRHLRNDVVMPPLFFTVANLHGNFTSKLIYILSVLNGSL